MKEPGWKTALNWTAVTMFFGLPLLVMGVQLLALVFPGFLSQELPQQEFGFLKEFERMLAALVFGLAGFKTWETVKNGHNNNKTVATKHNEELWKKRHDNNHQHNQRS